MAFKVEPIDKDKKQSKDIVVNFNETTKMMAYIIRLKGQHRVSGQPMYLGYGISGQFWTSNRVWAHTFATKPRAEIEFNDLMLNYEIAEILDVEWEIA